MLGCDDLVGDIDVLFLYSALLVIIILREILVEKYSPRRAGNPGAGKERLDVKRGHFFIPVEVAGLFGGQDGGSRRQGVSWGTGSDSGEDKCDE